MNKDVDEDIDKDIHKDIDNDMLGAPQRIEREVATA